MIQSAIPPAVHVIVAIIPIVGITFGAVIIFFYLLWRHHEIKLQIKTGSFVHKNFNFEAFSLLTGLILTGNFCVFPNLLCQVCFGYQRFFFHLLKGSYYFFLNRCKFIHSASFNNRVSQCSEVFQTLQADQGLCPADQLEPALLIPRNTSSSNQRPLFHRHQTSLE